MAAQDSEQLVEPVAATSVAPIARQSNEEDNVQEDDRDTSHQQRVESVNTQGNDEEGEVEADLSDREPEQPPLPDEDQPPLPEEDAPSDDGWFPVWSAEYGVYYFTNRYTGVSQWENPRVPEAANVPSGHDRVEARDAVENDYIGAAGRYNPAIHGDYDPEADYAVEARQAAEQKAQSSAPWSSGDGYDAYVQGQDAPSDPSMEAQPQFNKRTGQFVNTALHPSHTPSAHTDDAKSYRQQNAFYDVDRLANSHEGRSLKQERRNQKLTKKELKAFQEKRREKKEKKRLAWLKD